MTSQISNRVIALLFSALLSVQSFMAQTSSMEALVGQSLSQLQNPTTESYVNCVAQLQRVEAIYPDSVLPKYQLALQSLNFAVMNPQAEQTEGLLAEAEQTIAALAELPAADLSDVCTLRGFLYMDRIVQDPARNGQRFYLDVIQNFEKALKANPDNALAKQLQEKFNEGMAQAMR